MSSFNTLNLIAADDAGSCNQLLGKAFSEGAGAVVLTTINATIAPQALDTLQQIHGAHPKAVVGCRVVDSHHLTRIQFPGWRWNPSQSVWHPLWLYELKSANNDPTVEPVSWLSHSGVLISKEAWETVGPFEARLGCSLAMIDWCLRARQHGYDILVAREAVMMADAGDVDHSIFEAMLLAARHGLPHGKFKLAATLLHRALNKELRLVRFWANYGVDIPLPKRVYWYLRNLIAVFGREPLRKTTQQVISGLRARAWK